MARYGRRTLITVFSYRGIATRVYESIRGARCCGKDVDPYFERCPTCHAAMTHEDVYLLCIPNRDAVAVPFSLLRHLDERARLQKLERINRRIIDIKLGPQTPKQLPPRGGFGAINSSDDADQEELRDLIERLDRSDWLAIVIEINGQL